MTNNKLKNIKMNGLYSCDPNPKYRNKMFEKDLYHCCNWTFNVVESADGTLYMVDSYWSLGNDLKIELTEENFDDFTLIFEKDKVKRERKDPSKQQYRVAVDSGGWTYPKYFSPVEE